MKKEATKQTKERDLDEAIEEASERMWKLHTRLGQSYQGRYAQLEDAIALGKLAERIKVMMDARHAMSKPLPDVRPEGE